MGWVLICDGGNRPQKDPGPDVIMGVKQGRLCNKLLKLNSHDRPFVSLELPGLVPALYARMSVRWQTLGHRPIR